MTYSLREIASKLANIVTPFLKESPLELRLDGISDLINPDYECYTFRAYIGRKPVAKVEIDRAKPNSKPELHPDSWYFDFHPPKPKPCLWKMKTEKKYWGRGIAGRLIEFANNYFKEKYGTPLHSGTLNKPNAVRVWEKLVGESKAVEYEDNRNRRWAML